jgi:DNA-binding NtrC family response regulator
MSESDSTDPTAALRTGSAARTLKIRDAELAVVEGPDAGQVFALPRGLVRVGKAKDGDVVLADASVSRAHFTLEDRAEGWLLRDLGSTNGTQLNGLLVREAYVPAGATIAAGATTLRFQSRESSFVIEPSRASSFGELIGSSLRMRELFGILERVAPTELAALLLGETGTGKELIARAIHEASPRRAAPFGVFDCASVEPSLIGAALFGHRKGSFTGATEDRKGAFRAAHGGTLFIDELGELPLDLQPRLLRVLERREVQVLGDDTAVRVDVRVVAATHRDLRALVTEGKFRKDLYYRLAGVVIDVPALRERAGDVVPLARTFLERARPGTRLSPGACARLEAHSWPGNVRELRAAMDRAAVLGRGPELTERDLMLEPGPEAPATAGPGAGRGPRSLEAVEREAIEEALRATGWNRNQAARILGIAAKTLREKIERYGLVPPT